MDYEQMKHRCEEVFGPWPFAAALAEELTSGDANSLTNERIAANGDDLLAGIEDVLRPLRAVLVIKDLRRT